MAKNAIAVVGIHTGIGKTFASAVMAEVLGADYWKPIQAGTEERDMCTVSTLITNGPERVHPEAVLLQMPASPHAAAAAEGIEIDYTTFQWPQTAKTLVVETAGGVLSPVSAHKTVADFVAHYHLPVVLVSQNYLGSINHTLMAVEVLKNRGLHIAGIIMSGEENPASESFIEQYSNSKIIMRIPLINNLNKDTFASCIVSIQAQIQQFTSAMTANLI